MLNPLISCPKASQVMTITIDAESNSPIVRDGSGKAVKSPLTMAFELERIRHQQNSAFKAEYCEQVVKFMAETGCGLTAFGGEIEIDPDVLYHWARTIPEFGAAVRIGTGKRAKKIERKLASPETGAEVTGAMFMAKNVIKGEYSDGDGDPGHTSDAVKQIAAAIQAGVKDALSELGRAAADTMHNMRLIDGDPGMIDDKVIEGKVVEIPVMPSEDERALKERSG